MPAIMCCHHIQSTSSAVSIFVSNSKLVVVPTYIDMDTGHLECSAGDALEKHVVEKSDKPFESDTIPEINVAPDQESINEWSPSQEVPSTDETPSKSSTQDGKLKKRDTHKDSQICQDENNGEKDLRKRLEINLVPHVDQRQKRSTVLEQPTKRKTDRAQLAAYDCSESCHNYYKSLGLSAEELAKRMKNCSRHRGTWAERPVTPPGFWNPNMPSTPEAIENGSMIDSEYIRQTQQKNGGTDSII